MELSEARPVLARLAAKRERGTGSVKLVLDGPVARIVLDHPEAAHALTVHMMVDLCDAIEGLKRWKGAAVILQASDPRWFCAGGHLQDVQSSLLDPDSGRCMAMAMGGILDTLLQLPIVSVAAVDGPAVGGGAELLTAVDHRVFSGRATVRFAQASLGVAPGWGGTMRLVSLVGRTQALRALSTATRWTAAEAQAMGLADMVCEGSAVEGALRFLEPVLKHPPAAVRAVKGQVAATLPGRVRSGLAEADWFATVWGHEDHIAALSRIRPAGVSTP